MQDRFVVLFHRALCFLANPRCVPVLVLFLSVFATLGCGGGYDGPDRYALYGTVTREGEPLREGTIQLTPNGGGPAAMTAITEGEYEFTAETGPVVGDHEVKIIRFLEKPPIPEGVAPKDVDPLPETGFESPMPIGGWMMKYTIIKDQDVGEPVDFNVDDAQPAQRR